MDLDQRPVADRHHGGVREQVVGHPRIGEVAPVAEREDPDPEIGARDFEPRVGHLAQDGGHRDAGIVRGRQELLEAVGAVPFGVVVEIAVQVGEMRGIDLALDRLQPVGPLQRLEHEAVARRRIVPVEARQRRRRAAAHIAVDDAVALGAGIGGLADALVIGRAGRLGGLFQTAPVKGVEPAVIGAAQPAVLAAPEGEVARAMGAAPGERPVPAPVVAEDDQILAEDADILDRAVVGKFLDQREGLPVAAHDRAHRRAGAGKRQAFVLFHAQHGAMLTRARLRSNGKGQSPTSRSRTRSRSSSSMTPSRTLR